MYLTLDNIEAAEVREVSSVNSSLTSYRGFWHHGGNVLGPVEWD